MFASQGLDTSRLLEAAAIDPAAVDQPLSRFDLEQVNRLWRLAVAASGQETLGLDRELAGRFIDMQIAATSMGSGASLWAVLESQSRYLALTDDASAFTLERVHPHAWLALTHGNDLSFARQRIEYSMLGIVLACQWSTRRQVRPLAAEFVFPEPVDAHRHRMAFPCPLRFDRPVNRLLLAARDLELPVVGGNPSVFLLEERVLESLLAAFGAARTSFRVAQEMVHRLRDTDPRAGSIAAGLGITEAALTRQLRTERTSLDALLDRVRRELAQEYLAASAIALAGIPALLGLRSEAEFTAACRRWFEESPSDYRLRHGPSLADS